MAVAVGENGAGAAVGEAGIGRLLGVQFAEEHLVSGHVGHKANEVVLAHGVLLLPNVERRRLWALATALATYAP